MINRAPLLAHALATSAGLRPPPPKLTDRQLEVLDEVDEYIKAHGYPPTERELARRMGINKSTVHLHITALFRKGALVGLRADGRAIARTWVVVRPAP